MTECEQYNPQYTTLSATDVDLFIKGYKWKAFAKCQQERKPPPPARSSERGVTVGWRVLAQHDRRPGGALQVLAARRAGTMLLDLVVPPKLRAEERCRHRETSMKTILDELSAKIRPSYMKSDLLLSNEAEQLSGTVKTMITRLQKVRNWLLFSRDAWQDVRSAYAVDDSDSTHILSVGVTRHELFLREMETATMAASAPGTGVLTKFVLQLLLGESRALAELRPQDTFTTAINFAPFLTLYLPQFRPSKVCDLMLRNIVLNNNKAFSNLLKWCPNLRTLECCVENAEQLTELGMCGERLQSLTLRGVPQHLVLENFSRAFFDIGRNAFLSMSASNTRWLECNKLANLEEIHLINAIVDDQVQFLLGMVQLSPNLKRVRSNFKPLPAMLMSVMESCNITELFFEGKSPCHFYNEGLHEHFPYLKAATLGRVDYVEVATNCHLALSNITELTLTANRLTGTDSDWTKEILPCLLRLRATLLSLHIKILGILDPKTLLKIFMDFKKLKNFSVEYRGSAPSVVPIIAYTNLQNFRLACIENKSDVTEALILASVVAHSPLLSCLDVEMSFNALVRALDAIEHVASLPQVRTLRINVPGDAEAVAREIEKFVRATPSLATVKVNDINLAKKLLEILRNTDVRVDWFLKTDEESEDCENPQS